MVIKGDTRSLDNGSPDCRCPCTVVANKRNRSQPHVPQNMIRRAASTQKSECQGSTNRPQSGTKGRKLTLLY